MSDDPREVLRCRNPKCRLNQFMTANGNCRKCREPLKEPEPAPIQIAATVENHRPLATGAQYDVGTAVWLIRTALGWSSYDLALKLGVPRSYVSKVETDKAEPRIKAVQRFAEAFGIPTAALVEIAHHVRNGRAA